MKLDITYPTVERRRLQRKKLLHIVRWPVLFAALICPVVNLVTGGAAWSIIVLMVLYMLWTLVLSPDLVEYNRISQFIKTIVCTCILLTLIDVFLAPGWAIEVVPIVCFTGLAVAGILFFTDLERQKQNMLPMLLLILFAIAGSVIGLSLWHEESRWALAVMGVFAICLLFACMISLGSEFLRELKRRFHTK
ncbi:DUF6320 domain-containing protein [Ihubacter sp. rT4E-8]|uniref:DUF6320 domain-containing protein n=1 Tax=Ihubacter sp. rT4E-8 TaxID=3242369 RepID=UPI003CF4EC6F